MYLHHLDLGSSVVLSWHFDSYQHRWTCLLSYRLLSFYTGFPVMLHLVAYVRTLCIQNPAPPAMINVWCHMMYAFKHPLIVFLNPSTKCHAWVFLLKTELAHSCGSNAEYIRFWSCIRVGPSCGCFHQPP